MRNGHTEVACPVCKARPRQVCTYVDPKNWKDQASWWRLPAWRQIQCIQRAGFPLENGSTHNERERAYKAHLEAELRATNRAGIEFQRAEPGVMIIGGEVFVNRTYLDDSVIAAYHAGKRVGHEEGRHEAINQVATGSYGG